MAIHIIGQNPSGTGPQDVVEAAAKLGRMLAAHPSFAALRAAETDVMNDSSTEELVRKHQEALLALQEKEEKMIPIEPAEKQAFMQLQEKASMNPKLQALAKAQAEYGQIMAQVNEAIFRELEPK